MWDLSLWAPGPHSLQTPEGIHSITSCLQEENSSHRSQGLKDLLKALWGGRGTGIETGEPDFLPLILKHNYFTPCSHGAFDGYRCSGRKLWAGVGSGGVRDREWDEIEADDRGYGVQGTLAAKAEVEMLPKGPLQKTLILLRLENPYILLEHPHGTTCPVFVI